MKFMDLFVTIGANADAFNRGIVSARTLAFSAAQSISNTLGGAMRGVANWAAEMVKLGVAYNIQMENYQTNFKVLLQSEEKAISLTKQLQKTAAETPFGMSDLADATQTLLSYQVNSEGVVDILKEIGDIALGDKNKLSTLASVYGQISMAGKLLTQDYKQLINVGFNPLTYIAQKTGETMEQLQARMSKGGISAKEVADAFKTAVSEGNAFYGGMENASKTLSGQWSTLTDNWAQFWGEVMKPVNAELSGTVVPKLIEKLQELSDALFGVEEESKALFTDENGNGFSPAAKINEWYDDLIKEWTDGKREDDETVQRFAESFKSNTKLIADAFRQRLDDTTLSDAERAEYEAKIARIEELNTAVEDLLKKRQGGYFTDEDKRNLQAYREELAALEQSLGTQAEAEKALTPWQSFVHELGVLIAGDRGVIDAIGDMVIGFVKDGGLDAVLENMNTFIKSLSDGTFQDVLDSFLGGVSSLLSNMQTIANGLLEIMYKLGLIERPDPLAGIEVPGGTGFEETAPLRTIFDDGYPTSSSSPSYKYVGVGEVISSAVDNTIDDYFDSTEYQNYAGRTLHAAGRFTGESFNIFDAWDAEMSPKTSANDIEIRQGDITVMIDSKSIAYELSTNSTLINGIAVALDQRSNRISTGRGQAR